MEALLAVALLLIGPPACAVVLRRLNVAGWSLVGGVIAGALLGPTLLGRTLPNVYEGVFVGGSEQREELQRLSGRHGADLLAARHAGADREVLLDMQARHARERAAAETALRGARWKHQLPQRSLAIAMVVAALLGARWMHGRKHVHVAEPPTGRTINEPLTIGLWMATVPGGLALLLAMWLWRQSPGEAALIAAAVMIGPWALTRLDRIAAERQQRGGAALIERAGRFATFAALLVAGWALWTLQGPTGLLWLLPLAAVFVIWITPIPIQRTREALPMFRFVVEYLIIPALAASVAVKIELFHHFAFWSLLALLILSGDGRWLGAVIGTMLLGGRTGMTAMKLALGAMACGPTQLTVIAIAAHAWLLDESMLLALLAGAVYVEVAVPMRRWFATM